MYTVNYGDCGTAGLRDCGTGRLRDCGTAGLWDCGTAGLWDYGTAWEQLPKHLKTHSEVWPGWKFSF